MELELYLIRHGKTICNEKKLYCGSSDVSLSENGIKELLELKLKNQYPSCEKYYTTGLKRTIETLKIIYDDVEFEMIESLKEYNFGDFEMKSYEHLKENKDYIKWIMDSKGNFKCPNGENKIQYKNRVKEGFKSTIENSFKDGIKKLVIVSHGGTIGTIIEEFFDSSKSFYEHQPSCGKGYKLIIMKNENDFEIKEVLQI